MKQQRKERSKDKTKKYSDEELIALGIYKNNKKTTDDEDKNS
jgi:hypothetical protein